jgi:hypothetical protein
VSLDIFMEVCQQGIDNLPFLLLLRSGDVSKSRKLVACALKGIEYLVAGF